MKRPLRSAFEYARVRLWEQAQRPNPDLVYERNGFYALRDLLHQSGDPALIRDVLRRYGADIHPECHPIGPNITIHEAVRDFSNLSIGRSVHIGKEVFLDLTDKLIIEESVGVGMRAILLTHVNLGAGYPNKPLARLIPKTQKPTILRRGCAIGAGAIIACGVTVGEDAVVNAGVVIDRDVPPRTIVTNTRTKPNFRIPDRFFDKADQD